MNFLFRLLVCFIAINSVSSVFVKTYPSSCSEIKSSLPTSVSGLYDIAVGNTIVTVYCEMALHGGGFTFIPRDAVQKGKLKTLVQQLFTKQTEVLLRIQTKNGGLQRSTLVEQLPQFKQHKLGIRMNNYKGYTQPRNYRMGDYLLLGVLPANAAKRRGTQGFKSNGILVTFNNCDKNPNSYFAFFPNHRQQPISKYHGLNLVYERRGVAVKWRRTGIPSKGPHQIPNDFFFLTELHFGGCGCYTSSNRWRDAIGAAIGLR